MVRLEENNNRLALAKQLVDQLESGSAQEAEQTIDLLAGFNENNLFREVGRLTRELHNAINGFLLDTRITELAAHEMPDASERLNYVIQMTENAAHTSLGAVEAGLPLAEELGSEARVLANDWQRFQQRELSVEEFRVLVRQLTDFLRTTGDYSGKLHGKLSEVLMAQDYQDLTGQIIRQVITLIRDVEDKLVRLVSLSGDVNKQRVVKPGTVLEGPAVPGLDQRDQVSGQDEVDDLLSSLGF
ncbi:MAG: protein phosphatase CheZ [Chromatiaceae bacterium]|nr:protein phosphatase CheZ [Chromatiaceae bacterium]